MTNDQPTPPHDPSPTTSGDWDAVEMLRARTLDAAALRDTSIAELRQVMDDQAILVEFGIDLSRLEG